MKRILKLQYFCDMNIIMQHKDKLVELCKNHNVSELYLFGSASKNKLAENSDVDLLITFENVKLEDYFDNYMDLKEQLEILFSRPVDLVENNAIKNPVFRKVVDRDKILVYDGKSAEVFV
ncbi:MAG: nucleotidyltransferase domain-containing protein [Bacteroidales bacterium]|nr:nucleotidyltransferase domain-containing protein [Bacteroidales bacterium]